MANPYHHAVSSTKKWGGKPEDYQKIHDWFDESKMMMADFRHRALRHHAEGCFMAERIFGNVITNSEGRKIPTRWVAEQHVKEDLGHIPSMQDWFVNIMGKPWMGATQKLEAEKVSSGIPKSLIGHTFVCLPPTRKGNGKNRKTPKGGVKQ